MALNKKALGIALDRLYNINKTNKHWDTSWRSEDSSFYVWTAHMLAAIFEHNGTLYNCAKNPSQYEKHIDNLIDEITKNPDKFVKWFCLCLENYSNSKNK